MPHLVLPLSTHFHPGKNGQVLLGSKILDTGNHINAIVVGHRNEVITFVDKVIN